MPQPPRLQFNTPEYQRVQGKTPHKFRERSWHNTKRHLQQQAIDNHHDHHTPGWLVVGIHPLCASVTYLVSQRHAAGLDLIA